MKKLLKKFANFLEGRFSIGNLTVFGDNAMHFGCHFWTKKYGFICWRLPFVCNISAKILYGDKLRWHPLYFYISRDATPWSAVFMIGKKAYPRDWALARARKRAFGWRYNCDDDYQYDLLYKINTVIL